MNGKEKTPQERPMFRIAHWYRCQGLCGRQNFLDFEQKYTEIVNTIAHSDGTTLWSYVRSLFAFDDYADCVPINSANLSILFHPVQLFVNNLALDWNRDISIQKRKNPFVKTIKEARETIAKELNVEPELLAFQRNGSDPNAAISFGLHFKKGEEVVVWEENHPTLNEVAWAIRKERFNNINIVVVKLVDEHERPIKYQDEIVSKFLQAVNKNTKIVAFSEVSHLSGTRLPAKRIIAAIRKLHGHVHIHVDGAQSWGAFKHDLIDMDCDSFSGGSHKWFLGPKETGILYMKRDRVQNFAPKDIGYDATMNPPPNLNEKNQELPPDASRFELVGQRNDTNVIGLLYAADIMSLIGFEKIEKRIKMLTTLLRKKLEGLLEDLRDELQQEVFEFDTPNDYSMYHGIMVIKFPEEEEEATSGSPVKRRKIEGKPVKSARKKSSPLNEQIYDRLYENHKIGVSTKKGNRLRFSPHIYNTEEHIHRVVEAMKFELRDILKTSSG